jgi:hypothetical protein
MGPSAGPHHRHGTLAAELERNDLWRLGDWTTGRLGDWTTGRLKEKRIQTSCSELYMAERVSTWRHAGLNITVRSSRQPLELKRIIFVHRSMQSQSRARK